MLRKFCHHHPQIQLTKDLDVNWWRFSLAKAVRRHTHILPWVIDHDHDNDDKDYNDDNDNDGNDRDDYDDITTQTYSPKLRVFYVWSWMMVDGDF